MYDSGILSLECIQSIPETPRSSDQTRENGLVNLQLQLISSVLLVLLHVVAFLKVCELDLCRSL